MAIFISVSGILFYQKDKHALCYFCIRLDFQFFSVQVFVVVNYGLGAMRTLKMLRVCNCSIQSTDCHSVALLVVGHYR